MPFEELINAIEKINELFRERNYDESFLVIEEALSEFPGSEEILNLKRAIEKEVKQKIEETKVLIRNGKYNDALANINAYLNQNPKVFAELEKEKKSIEENLEHRFSEAKDEYEKGNKDVAFKIFEELISIPESDAVKSQFKSIQQMISEDEKAPEEEIPPPSEKSGVEKKFEEAVIRIEKNKFEEAKQLLNEIIQLEPENEEAKKILKLLDMSSKEIPNLFWQNKYDDALLLISIYLSKFPENQEILSYKWRIESVVTRKKEEVKLAIKEERYKNAVSIIRDALNNNPRAFKELNQLKKSIEKYTMGKFSQAQRAYKKGDKEEFNAIVKEIKSINERNIIEPSETTIQKWIDEVEGKKKVVEAEAPEEKKVVEAEVPKEGKEWEQEFTFGVKVSKPSPLKQKIIAFKDKIKRLLGWIKSHPIHTAGGIGGLGILIVAVIFLLPGGPKEQQPPPPSMGYILLVKQERIDYSGVTATINNSSLPIDKPKAQKFQVGAYNISFQKEGHSFEKQINIVENETNKVEIPLIPLEVNIQPSGEIWEGDSQLKDSSSSHVLFLLPSEYIFNIRENDYLEEERNVILGEKNQPASLDIELNRDPSTLPGTLIAKVFPSGRVYEGNQLLASFPPIEQRISLSPGTHNLRFTTSEEGCGDSTRNIRIRPRQTETITVYLCLGTLNINSIPPGAAILIDDSANDFNGRPYGTTPKANIRVPVGPHSLTIHHPDHPPRTIQVVIQTNKTINKSLDLTNE